MFSITYVLIFLSTLLFISQSAAAPTSHKATIQELTPKTSVTPRGTLGDISDIIDIATDVIDDILEFITDIDDAEHDIESQFTQNLVDALYNVAPTANIMVCHDCSFELDPNAFFTHYELDISDGLGFTQGYDIAVFDYGTVQNLGDGGYINWCMQGDFSSDGSLVTFAQMADDGY
jgi:hypothetical protein